VTLLLVAVPVPFELAVSDLTLILFVLPLLLVEPPEGILDSSSPPGPNPSLSLALLPDLLTEAPAIASNDIALTPAVLLGVPTFNRLSPPPAVESSAIEPDLELDLEYSPLLLFESLRCCVGIEGTSN